MFFNLQLKENQLFNFIKNKKMKNLKKKMTSIFQFEQKANLGLWSIFTLDFIIEEYTNFLNLFPKFFLEINCLTNKTYSFNLKEDKNFIWFISESKIYFSNDNALDVYLYNEVVLKYKSLPKTELLKKLNLPNDFFKNQEKIEQNLHKRFWNSVSYSNEWFYDTDNLYIDDVIVPYKSNEYLSNLIKSSFENYNSISWYLGWELKNTHYYEVFHFLRNKGLQPMFDYRTLMFLWYRTMFFEDLIFADPNKKFIENPEHPFPPLSYWATPWETRYGYERLKDLINFVDNIFNLNFITQFLDFSSFNFDKNFVIFWHYIWGGYLAFDFVYDYSMINWLQKIWTEIINPTIQIPSAFTTTQNPYFSSYEKTFYMSIFPDTLVTRGRFSTFLDYWTADYNRFFHSGFTFIDSLSLLDMWRYHGTAVIWGDYESFIEDFIVFQPAYLADQFQAIWVSLVALLVKQTRSLRLLDLFISNYNSVFYFTMNPDYEAILEADLLFPLSREEWLSLFYEEVEVDQKLYQSERLACMLYGYNVSMFINNHPDWYIDMWRSMNTYEPYGCHTDNDEDRELLQEWLLKAYNLKYSYNNHPLFMHYQYGKITTYFDYFYDNNFIKYINQKFYDEIGFFFSSIMRADTNLNWSPFLNFNDLIFNYLSSTKFLNETWVDFYPVIKFFNLNYLEIDHKALGFDRNIFFYIKNWCYETFEIGWWETLVWEAFMRNRNLINYAATCPRYIGFYFTVWLDKILNLFLSKQTIYTFLNSKLFFPIHFFGYSHWSTFEIITKEQLINGFYFFRSLLEKNYIDIKIFDESILSYFDFISNIYKSEIFQYFFDLLFKKILVWQKPLVGTSIIVFENYPLKAAMVDFIDCWSWPLPLEFYIPILIRPEEDYIIRNVNVVELPFNIKLSNYFFNNNLTFDKYLEKVMILIMINDLLTECNKFDNDALHKLLVNINSVKYDWVSFNEFDRYLNYVLKKKLYYQSSVNENKNFKNEISEYWNYSSLLNKILIDNDYSSDYPWLKNYVNKDLLNSSVEELNDIKNLLKKFKKN